jgi:hypothetical protein
LNAYWLNEVKPALNAHDYEGNPVSNGDYTGSKIIDGSEWGPDVVAYQLRGWHRAVGASVYDYYDADGKWLRRKNADNSWTDFIWGAAVALGGPAIGSALGGAAGAGIAAGDAFLPGALGTTGQSAYAVAQSSAFSSSIAPWAAATTASPTAASWASSVSAPSMSTVGQGVGLVRAVVPVLGVGAAVAAGGSRGSPAAGGYAANGAPLAPAASAGGMVAGMPLELILVAGAAFFALG